MSSTDNIKFRRIWSVVLILIIGYFIVVFGESYVRVKSSSNFMGCQSNMNKIGKALDRFTYANNYRYPQKYSRDFHNIVDSIPLCPVFKAKNKLKKTSTFKNPYYRGYEVDSTGYRFTICCKGENHINLGVDADYPKYSSVYGVLSGNVDQIGGGYYKQIMAVYTAVYENNPALVKELLAKKPDFSEEVDTLGRTPLHTAAAFGYIEIAEMLIAQGVDINPRDEGGWTPLKWAKSRNRTEMVKLLKKHGAVE